MAPEFIPFIAVVILAFVSLASLGVFVVGTLLSFFSKRWKRALRITSAISGISTLVFGVLLFLLGSGVYKQYFLNEPMVTAASQGNIEDVRQFLDRGASPDAYGIDYVETALIAAVKFEREDIVILLLSRGANPELRDYKGETALDHAGKAKNRKMVDLLHKAVREISPNQPVQTTETVARSPRLT